MGRSVVAGETTLITFKVLIKRTQSIGMKQSEFNRAVRIALTEAGLYWQQNFLHRHFEASAFGRYNYAPRGYRYQNRKRYVTHREPLPLVFLGELRDYVLSNRDKGAIRVQSTATATRQQVRVPVRLPHPINPKNRGELTRPSSAENKEIGRYANRVLRELLQRRITETVVVG